MINPFAAAVFARQRRQRLLAEAEQDRLLRQGRPRRYGLMRRLWPADALRAGLGRDKSQPLRTRQLT